MHSADEKSNPARAKAVLVDPATLAVLWMNEPAARAVADRGFDGAHVTLEQAVPMAEALGVPEVLRAVADSGVAQHLLADLVSTAKGSMAQVTSVYRLPDGGVLVLMEQAWQVAPKESGQPSPRRTGRRSR